MYYFARKLQYNHLTSLPNGGDFQNKEINQMWVVISCVYLVRLHLLSPYPVGNGVSCSLSSDATLYNSRIGRPNYCLLRCNHVPKLIFGFRAKSDLFPVLFSFIFYFLVCWPPSFNGHSTQWKNYQNVGRITLCANLRVRPRVLFSTHFLPTCFTETFQITE